MYSTLYIFGVFAFNMFMFVDPCPRQRWWCAIPLQHLCGDSHNAEELPDPNMAGAQLQ